MWWVLCGLMYLGDIIMIKNLFSVSFSVCNFLWERHGGGVLFGVRSVHDNG